MAGIGFTLRQLTRQDDLGGILRAYAHASVSTSGPWLATVLALGTISLAAQGLTRSSSLETFRLIVIYNFALSLILCGPFMLVATRQISDLIFARRIQECGSVLLTAMCWVTSLGAVLSLTLYAGYSYMPAEVALAGSLNFILISGIWTASIFLTTLKAYNRVTLAFMLGLVSGTTISVALASDFGTIGLLTGFNIGLSVTLFSLLGQVFAEYPPGPMLGGRFLQACRRYWLLGLSGFVYNFALWIDKFVMWFLAPERTVHDSGLIVYPAYDSAMFTAFLTVMPGLALYMVVIETSFFESYNRFYQDLLRHANLEQIKTNQQRLIRSLIGGFRNLFILQGAVSLFFLLGASQVYDALGIDFTHLTIFRFGVIGAFLQVMLMFVFVTLAYFDLRLMSVTLQGVFLLLAGGLSYLTIQLGYPYYGLGPVFAAGLTFMIAFVVLARFLQTLPYQAFVRYNSSVS